MGDHKSGQVSKRAGVAAGAVVATGTGAAVGAVAAAGAASGVSSGFASGLTALGAAAGGGAVTGIAMVAAAPALAMTGLLSRTIYRHNPCQPKSERVARRIGTATTAAIGIVSTVSAFGAPALGATGGGA